jgi:hypothetical protein
MATPHIPIFDQTDPYRMECGVFSRLQVVTYPLGGSIIAWGLHSGFEAAGPYHFYVDFGRAGTHDEWKTLTELPIVDSCVFLDAGQRYFDHLVDYYYRVRLVLPNVINPSTGLPVVHLSMPQQANGLLCRRDWLIARDISRKEYLLQRKRTNITAVGFLLKRRRWGQVCEKCKEFDCQETQNSKCPLCFGTGFVGGYFKAVDFRITTDAPWTREFKRDPQIGNRNDLAKRGRAMSYPWLDTNDVYMRRDNGERSYINAVDTVAEIGGIPLVVSVELRLAPVTDIIYTIPPEGGSSSSVSPSSSVSSGSSQEWRTGLKDDTDW